MTETPRAAIKPLTGIRGIAALWVVCFHMAPELGSTLGLGPRLPVVDRGYLAVDLFFLLSGYVLTMTAAPRFAVDWAGGAASFLIGRVTRILPLNVAVLLIVGAMGLVADGLSMAPPRDALKTFLACLVLVQSWWPGHSADWNYPAWSLSAEWATYGTFALLAPFVMRTTSRGLALGLCALCWMSLVALLALKHSLSLSHTSGLAIPRCAFEFYMGAMLCRAGPFGRLGASSAILAVVIVSLVASTVFTDTDLLAPVFFALVIVASASPNPAAEWLFGNKVVYFLGEISFSIYLCHAPLLTAASYLLKRGSVGGVAVIPVYLFDLMCIATATYHLIEKPLHSLGRRLQRGRAQGRGSLLTPDRAHERLSKA